MKKLLEKTRYLAIVGIASLILAALAAFGWGLVKTVGAVSLIVTSYGQDPHVAISLIELVEGFLIAAALLIFAVSMYGLFVGELALPDWMVASNLHELESKLSSMVILIMAVKFLEHLEEWEDPQDTVLFGVAIAVVSATLIALDHFGGKK
ncbi:MAG: YqhA family protein [Chloroflexota bacterium]|nr:YqhA family protein [Chloroflexota bacterium]